MAYFSFEKDGGRKLATQAAVVACILLVAGWFTIRGSLAVETI
jgi:hypothetical protein